MARLKKIEDQLRRMQNSSAFFGTGVHPNGEQGLDSDNYVQGVSGFTLNGGTGNAEFNDIILRDLPNSMLANPVVPGVVNVAGSNFPVTTTFTEVAGMNVTVPDDCTRLLATASGWAFARNPNTSGGADTTGTDALWCFVRVAGIDSQTYGHGISGSGGYTTATAGVSVLASNLTPGATVRVAVYAGASFQTLPTDTQNRASVSATLQWLR
jgi:hypothetical protein